MGGAVIGNDDAPEACGRHACRRHAGRPERELFHAKSTSCAGAREAERVRARGCAIGARIVRDGELLEAAHNERELRQDPTAHAEVLALREAARSHSAAGE